MKNRPADILDLDKTDFSFTKEEALDIILNNLQEVFLLVDKNLRIVCTSEQTREVVLKNYGITITGKTSVLELVAPERHPFMLDLYSDVFKGIERKTVIEVTKANGTISIQETHFRPARNVSGEIVGAVIISNDITDKIVAETSLKQAEERWRFALEGGNQGVWDWNVQTGAIFFSDSYKKLYGYAPDELEGKIEEWEKMIHPDDREKMKIATNEHIGGEDPYHESTYRIKAKDGSYKWILGRGMLIRNQEGVPVRMIGTHTDINKQIVAEEELKKSNERFVFASRATSDAIYDWNLITNELYWGEGLHTLFGFDPKEVSISMWENLLHPDDRKQIQDSLNNALNNPETELWKAEYRFAKANGGFSYVLESGFIIRGNDKKAIRMIGALQDFTERKYTEQILSLERSVFELSNQPDTNFKYIVETLLKGIEEIHDDAYTSLVLLKDNDTIQSFVAPRLSEDYSQKLNGAQIGPYEGSCGTAMWNKGTVIVEDIETHPSWEKYKSLVSEFGLKSCWSLPIIHSSGKVIGAFAIYYKKAKSPSSVELNTLERVRNILRILLEHHLSLDEIKKANERFDIIIKATHDLIWDWDLQTNLIYRDALGLQKVYGVDDNKSIENIQQWFSHIHPGDIERVQNVIADILQAKEQDTFDVEYRFRRNDGSYSYVYDRGMILRNEEGKPVRMIGAAQDVTERKHLEDELLKNELEKQKAINQATVDSQEQERTEIGKELHDNVNQILTTTKLYLELALSNSELKDELIQKSNKNIISVINEIRQLSRSLMDPTIGDLGLIDSINDLVENINLTRRLSVTLEAERRLELLLNKNQKLTIFRIIQEALNNTMKYAKATTVVIRFQLFDSNMEVTIHDDGIGFEPSAVKMGAGLKNIQNRVYLINGRYRIQTSPKNGCKIIINFPINK
jgi:PAS domain S-box-containing protein